MIEVEVGWGQVVKDPVYHNHIGQVFQGPNLFPFTRDFRSHWDKGHFLYNHSSLELYVLKVLMIEDLMRTNFCRFFLPSSSFQQTSFKTVIALIKYKRWRPILMSKVTDSRLKRFLIRAQKLAEVNRSLKLHLPFFLSPPSFSSPPFCPLFHLLPPFPFSPLIHSTGLRSFWS